MQEAQQLYKWIITAAAFCWAKRIRERLETNDGEIHSDASCDLRRWSFLLRIDKKAARARGTGFQRAGSF
jgi:hypothetical protein